MIGIMVLGGVLIYFGYQEYAVGAGAGSQPKRVDLAGIEQGGKLDNTHVQFGDHMRLYYGLVYTFENATGTNPSSTDSVTKAYYPIISSEHMFARRMRALLEKHGDIDNIPEEQLPQIEKFKVLLKSTEYDTAGEVDRLPPVRESQSVKGLVVNSINSLDSEEESLIRQSFPGVDLDRIIILEKDRKPMSVALSMGMIAGGVAMIAFPVIGLVVMHKRSKAKEEAALASAEGNFAGGFSPDAATGPSTVTESAVGEVPPPPPTTGGDQAQKNDQDDEQNPYRV
ncbi:MAG: hypothetical protein ACLFVH_08135 [Phycisphaerae bacterium]